MVHKRKFFSFKNFQSHYLGLRPFGVSILFMGWDPHYQFQLYQSDPSGNYGGWKATCVGNNHQAAISMLKQEYKDDTNLKSALELAVKVLHKTLDSTKLNSEKGNDAKYFWCQINVFYFVVEFATLTRKDNKTIIEVLPSSEVDVLIKRYQEEVEAKKKEKEKQKAAESQSKME